MDAKSWNQDVLKAAPRSGAFLQSWGWGAFQESLGKIIHRDTALLIRNDIAMGIHYWYCGRGVASKAPDNATFLRLDAPTEETLPNSVSSPHDVQPRTTILLDLTKSEGELLKEMHPKTRYNIKVGEKRGVTIELVGAEGFEDFWRLLEATTERDAFRAHPKVYYQMMLEDHADADVKVFLAIARVDGKAAAAALMIDFGDTRTYLHGASDYTVRDAMAPYALHWYLIQDAKKQGVKAYDFWGIAPTEDPKEPLAGVTRFKKGWGGEVVRYPRTQDLILRPWKYKLYRFLHRLLTRP